MASLHNQAVWRPTRGATTRRRGSDPSAASTTCRSSRREVLFAGAGAALGFGPTLGAHATTTNEEVLARDYDRYSENYDGLEVGELAKAFELSDLRSAAVAQATGRTLEIGIGTGINLDFYDFDRVTHLTGLDISQGMLDKSEERVRSKKLEERVDLVRGDATTLPFGADTFDTVVVTYALCVIPNAPASLGEIARVLKSSGSGFLVEHIASDIGPLATYQGFISPFIAKFGKGCDPSKDIPAQVQQNGLRLVDVDRRVAGTVALIQVAKA